MGPMAENPDEHGDEHGSDHGDEHGGDHGGEQLGPFDVPMWGAAGLGVLLGLAGVWALLTAVS
jgi:hypothetical protein